MAEFTQTMSGDSRYSIKLTVTEVIPSDYITTNKTNVNYTLTATKSGGSGYWSSSAINPVKVTINDTDVVNTNISYDFRNATPKTITLASGTVTGISHNADGTKTIAVSGYFKDSANSLGQATASGNLILTTIPRASQPTLYDLNDNIRTFATLGENLKIETFRASSNFKHTLQIKIGNSVVEQFTNVDAEKNPWSPAISTYAPYITNGSSTTATIVCTTYNGSTNLGTKSQTITINVPNNASTKPTASISVSKGDNVVPSSWGVYVKGKSKLNVTITGTPKYGTTISNYSSSANGGTYNTSTYTTNELTGSGEVRASVTDKRGFASDVATSSYTVVDYSAPKITTATAIRCDSDGTPNDEGTYIKYNFVGSISPVSNKNAKTFRLKWKPKNGSDTTVGTWTDSYTCNKTGVLSGFSITTEYVFTFEAIDQFNSISTTTEVGTVADIFNFNPDGESLAVGGISQRSQGENVQDVYKITEFHKSVVFDNYITNNQFVMGKRISAGGGTSGYFYVCDITHSGTYSQQFVEFTFLQRARYGKMILSLAGNGTAGSITGVTACWIATYDSSIKAYYTLSNNKVSLYVQKQQGWDDLEVYIKKGHYEGNMNIAWVNTTVTSLPSGAGEVYGATLRVSITGSAVLATRATQDENSENLVRTYAHAKTTGATSFDDVGGGGKLQRGGLYTENIGNIWYNIINVRHRNGEGDGTGYGLQIRSAMVTSNIESARLQYRNQYTGNGWTGWQTITPDSLKGCAMLKLTSNYSFSATAWADTQVAFSGRSSLTNSNSTLFEQSGNGIKCKFAGWVQVVGAVGTDKTNEFDAGILKGSTQIIRAVNTGGRQSFVTGICQVASGDIIYLSFASENTSGTIYNTTHFTITRVS